MDNTNKKTLKNSTNNFMNKKLILDSKKILQNSNINF